MVGFDGGPGGRDAMALARQLVAPDGELVKAIVHVLYGAKLIAAPSLDWDDDENERSTTTDLSGDADDLEVRTITALSIGGGLHELAAREHVDLLVVGSTRHGIIGRVLIGDGTREALECAPCAVAIAPAGYAEHGRKIKSVGVGYNGSEESKHAVQVARSLAAELDAHLSAIEVVNFPTCAYLAGATFAEEGVIDRLLADALKDVEQLGDVDAHTAFGQVGEELARYSDGVDLLIVGSRDYGPVGLLVHTSTSRYLVRTCRCPLVILTKGARSLPTAHPVGANGTAATPGSVGLRTTPNPTEQSSP